MDWNWKGELFFEALPFVAKGIWVTLSLTIVCYIFALVFGFGWTFLKRVPNKAFNWVVTWVMEFIRSTPPLVQLYFIYYAWPEVPYIGATLSPFTSAVIGLGIHFSTYISEVYRSGIEGVDKGQWEASTALNFSTRQKWTKIILPQAIPPTIPMLGNYLIILFKEVPLAAVIGVVGILHLADDFGQANFRFLEAYTVVALLFLLLSYPSALLVKQLEKKVNYRFDKKSPNGKKPLKESKGAVS
ncbi:General L-amino acid transport system permease protein AapM [Lentibacillus sp. JNUCC-1]|uniref:ectoine/hydroxyectoine ABC transporter permease subunit EhuD n=1 Tax=Lentibacillus sp. JNUCC-1 TaxID=2654513 RepID=UPI0012E8B24D|nr:ectoine/hydroxyectoine ABC transporter permease subunit EhuD [Lentibacillus sp. JNUCC-1]MUV38441.1 General L-amino acid transport system permease protein AapM [Lentibacillus sp. JNUCC-1]